MSKVLDFFSYYNPYGSELLLLRYHILKDYIDEFIVSEANRSHTGFPVEFKAKKKIKEWGLPEEKFRVIEVEIPPDKDLKIEKIDILNCYDFYGHNTQTNIDSIRCRTRDRMCKDSLISILDEYDDDTVIFHGDIDEIINPKYIEISKKIALENLDSWINFPLIYLEGRADLRVYNKITNMPEDWSAALFCSTKYFLKKVNPTNLRSNKLISEGSCFIYLNKLDTGERLEDVGWHFSWMGGKESKVNKKNSWCHHHDKFNWLIHGEYKDKNIEELLVHSYNEGDIPPCGNINLVLKKFPISELPKQIWELPIVEKFLFP